MSQINIRIPEEDYKLLELIAKKENMPITSLFKIIINPTFEKWKIDNIITLYQQGGLRFKEAANLSKLSLNEFILLLSKKGVEPPHLEEAELISAKIADKITRKELFKNPNYLRKSKEKVI